MKGIELLEKFIDDLGVNPELKGLSNRLNEIKKEILFNMLELKHKQNE